MSEPTRPAESMPDAGAGPDTLPVVSAVPDDAVPAVLPLERRAVLRVAGVAGVAGLAAVGLAACSSAGDSGSANGSANGGTGTSAAPMPSDTSGGMGSASAQAGGSGSGTALGATSQIPVGGGMIFASQKIVVTQPTAGTFKGFSSTCTHAGCQVSQVSGGTIDCPCHGSKYSITDGSVQAGPAPQPLPAANVTVQGGQLFLKS
ncbi:MAG TPA: Rieske (2Fe-2S) protein [Actinocrinis sp.]|uniref:Rieske (2Fe-2S) protein n=1 Tax=Actinocrinis sp. TaxID=1920516 RepID=UPI002DDD3A30|nr:Rieske (2Fe-2S) protein [Actinocrinis sp.]HEV3172832.1 Rieske (2Fe-2S) protein [Actinocrinis sp.]